MSGAAAAQNPGERPRRTEYVLRDASGVEVATHVRIDKPDGDKDVFWVDPEGRKGIGGMTSANLPLYGIDRVLGKSRVVLCEGEKAAQALLDAGIPAVGTVTGASTTPSDLPLSELGGMDVVLWPDADDVGRDHMLRISSGLKGIAGSVRWVVWPEAEPHDDAYDALARHGRDKVLDLLRNSGPVPDRDMTFERRGLTYWAYFPKGRVELTFSRVKVRSGDVHGELLVRSDDKDAPGDGHLVQGSFNASSMQTRNGIAKLIASRLPKSDVDWPDYLEAFCRKVLQAEREGLPFTTVGGNPVRPAQPMLLRPLLPAFRASVLFGEGGSGKSYLAAAIAVQKATGYPVIKGWAVDNPGRVLILDWEADDEEWNDRIALLAKGAGYIGQIAIDYRRCQQPLTDQVEEISRYVAEKGIELIIVDSVEASSPVGREGTDANDRVVRLFQALRQIGGTALLIDHVTKSGNDGGSKNPYGSVFKTNLARMTFELRRTSADNDSVAHLVLTNRKANGGPRIAPIGLRQEYGEGYVTIAQEAVDENRPPSDSMSIPDRIIATLQPLGTIRKPSEIETITGLGHGSISPNLDRLVKRGTVIRLPSGGYVLRDPSSDLPDTL